MQIKQGGVCTEEFINYVRDSTARYEQQRVHWNLVLLRDTKHQALLFLVYFFLFTFFLLSWSLNLGGCVCNPFVFSKHWAKYTQLKFRPRYIKSLRGDESCKKQSCLGKTFNKMPCPEAESSTMKNTDQSSLEKKEGQIN